MIYDFEVNHPLELTSTARERGAQVASSRFFNELTATSASEPVGPMAIPPQGAGSHWAQFFSHLGAPPDRVEDDLARRAATLGRQVRDNGVSFNLFADPQQPVRPWSLDLFPLIISPQDWQRIELGVRQRAQLLEHLMQDLYGPQRLLASAGLPAALIQGHPGYVRAMQGVRPQADSHLHLIAVDVVRLVDGQFAVVSQRTQAPSGLGYLLENRLLVSRQFPQAFEAMGIQRLAASYRRWMDALTRHCPVDEPPHVALLTPGPYSQTYFEHVYLARYLGMSLVEGQDLTVRDQKVYLRTLRGLERVHVLLKRLDDDFLDPLELNAESTLGVPGLLQAIRSGHVVVANTPGASVLESAALHGFMPALSEQILGQPLVLPALETWWCGERSVLPQVLGNLQHLVIKPTFSAPSTSQDFEPVMGSELSSAEVRLWQEKILAQPERYTLQAMASLSRMPGWSTETRQVGLRPVMLRVFALRDGPDSWQVLPGGLARLVGPDTQAASMQRGGGSADVWVQTQEAVDRTTLLKGQAGTPAFALRRRVVTSRAAENLFWLGRYTERAENLVRWVRLTLEALNGEDPISPPLIRWLHKMAHEYALAQPLERQAMDTLRPELWAQGFGTSVIKALDAPAPMTSIGFNLRALKQSAFAVRERLATETWRLTEKALWQFSQDCTSIAQQPATAVASTLAALDSLSASLAAITGAQTDRMTRDDGWQLLSLGRHVERLGFLSEAMAWAVEFSGLDPVASTGELDNACHTGLLALFDSSITYRAQHQQSRELQPLLELLVLDDENPRALAWVARAMRGRWQRVSQGVGAGNLPWPEALRSWQWPSLVEMCTRQETGELSTLRHTLTQCAQSAWDVSDTVTAGCFRHIRITGSLGV